ncbi:MAG: divalent-cation tolerance protein CutA [Candidatus Hodarchaeota archaeon]
MECIVVFVTCPADSSKEIATKIVEERLAACVNVVEGVESFYWWQTNLETDTEAFLIMKTKLELFKSLEELLRSIHPYENPEIIALPIIQGSSKYLEWIKAETRQISG